MKLTLTPISLKQAREFIAKYHRHSKPPVGWKFGVGLLSDDILVGVGVIGRPVARALDDNITLEITRVATQQNKNGCSMIYGALCRAAKAIGYKSVITYTLHSESGISLKAAGFTLEAVDAGGGSWNSAARSGRYDNKKLQGKKNRWRKIL